MANDQTFSRPGIGGSSVHHLFNEPPWGCRRRLWFELRHVEADYPREVTLPMKRGTALEPVAADYYAEVTGRRIAARGTAVSIEHRWAHVNVDRAILDDPRGPGVLELKVPGYFEFRRVKNAGMQPGYILQLQHGMLVTGHTWGSFGVLHADSWQMLHFDMPRDDELIAQIVEAGESFSRQVEHGPMPDPLPEIDRRCATCPWRRQCRGDELLKAAHLTKDELSETLTPADDLDDVVADYREAKKIADDADETLDLVKDALRERLGDRRAVQSNGCRIYYRPQISMRVDSAMLKGKFADVYQKVIKPSESRPLKVYEL